MLLSKSVNFKCHCFSYTGSGHMNYGSVTFYTLIQSQWLKQLVAVLLLSQLSCIHRFEVSSFSVAVSEVKNNSETRKVITFTLFIFWGVLKSKHRQVILFFQLQGKEFFGLQTYSFPLSFEPQNVHTSKNKDDFIGAVFLDDFLYASNLSYESFRVNVVWKLDRTKVTNLIRTSLFPLLATDNLENQHQVSNYQEAKAKLVSQLQLYIYFSFLKHKKIKWSKTENAMRRVGSWLLSHILSEKAGGRVK